MIGFTKKRKIWYIISAVIIVLGLISMAVRGFNLGIDFTGGSIIQVRFAQAVEVNEIREIVEQQVAQSPSIQSTDDNSFNIRTSEMTETGNQSIIQALEAEFGEVEIIKSDLIGPVVGRELLRNAQLALGIALILMLVYISIRFKLNYALSAVLALCHDVLVLLSVFSFFQFEVGGTFIAAVLTVVGYSINNTIVVFDRVRENMKKAKAKEDFSDVIDASISQTLARSINTVLAVLFVLFALFLFGGETTKVFALALIVGNFAGFYSSLLLAGSMLLDITNFRNKSKKARPAVS